MKKKLQVFVSSTFLDLTVERQKAVEGILRAKHIPAGMELFTAASKSQWKVIEDWIKESDILMLILGGRYGTVEPESGKSYIQLEYEYAIENNIPVFALVLNESFLANKKSKDINLKVYEREVDKPEIEKYGKFKAFVELNLVKYIADINEISAEVALSLQDFVSKDFEEFKFRGWVRGSEVDGNSLGGAQRENKWFEKDEALLDLIISKIEENSLIHTIDSVSSRCSYKSEDFRGIDELIDFSEKPSSRFFNDTAQGLFVKLITELNRFVGFTSKHFFSRWNGRLYLYPELNVDLNDVDEEGIKRYDQYHSDLLRISSDLIKEIKSFVHESRIALYK